MGCGCGKNGPGTLDAPRTIERPLTAQEIADRMPRRPTRRVPEDPNTLTAPRRTR